MSGAVTFPALNEQHRRNPSEISDSYGSSSQYAIPHMILSGTLKDGGKEGYHACVQRFCMLRITSLEMLFPLNSMPSAAMTTSSLSSSLSSLDTVVVFAVGLERTRKTLHSIPIEIRREDIGNTLHIDFLFTFHYLHNLKPPFDTLRIMIQVKTKKKHQREQKLVGYANVNLREVLQSTLHDDLILYTRRVKKVSEKKNGKKGERELRKQEKKEEKNARKREKKGQKKEKKTAVDLGGHSSGNVSLTSTGGNSNLFTNTSIKFEKETKEVALSMWDKDKEKDQPSQHKEREKHGERSIELGDPIARIGLEIAIYPEEVENLHDAQEWDDELAEAMVAEPKEEGIGSSSEEECYESESSVSEEENLNVLAGTSSNSNTLLATISGPGVVLSSSTLPPTTSPNGLIATSNSTVNTNNNSSSPATATTTNTAATAATTTNTATAATTATTNTTTTTTTTNTGGSTFSSMTTTTTMSTTLPTNSNVALQPTTVPTVNNSSGQQLLSEILRARYQTSRGKQSGRGVSRKLNLKKYLKLPRVSTKSVHHRNGASREMDLEADLEYFDSLEGPTDFAPSNEISLGFSSDSEDGEDIQSPSGSPKSSAKSQSNAITHSMRSSPLVSPHSMSPLPNPSSAPLPFSATSSRASFSSSPGIVASSLGNLASSTNISKTSRSTSMSSDDWLTMNRYLRSSLDDSIPLLVLISSQTRRGRRLEECIEGNLKSKVISTKLPNEVFYIFNTLISKQQARRTNVDDSKQESSSVTPPMKVVIAGGDIYVSHVMRAYLEISSKKPRGWQGFSFYILPLGKKNDIALHLASQDATYRQLFFAEEWRNAFDKQEDINKEEAKDIDRRIRKYIADATFPYFFPIGEALLSYPRIDSNTSSAAVVQKNVPFIKGLQIGSRDNDEFSLADVELQLDYWFSKKKGEGHKELKSLQYAAITRLHSVANALHIGPESRPTSTTFSLMAQCKDKSTKDKVKEALTRFSKKEEKKDEVASHLITARINRIMCSTNGETNVFKVLIDDTEWNGIKFLSVSPQWSSHEKNFLVQGFPSKHSSASIVGSNPTGSSKDSSTNNSNSVSNR